MKIFSLCFIRMLLIYAIYSALIVACGNNYNLGCPLVGANNGGLPRPATPQDPSLIYPGEYSRDQVENTSAYVYLGNGRVGKKHKKGNFHYVASIKMSQDKSYPYILTLPYDININMRNPQKMNFDCYQNGRELVCPDRYDLEMKSNDVAYILCRQVSPTELSIENHGRSIISALEGGLVFPQGLLIRSGR